MRNLFILFVLFLGTFLYSAKMNAQTASIAYPSVSPTPGACPSSISNVKLYRCVCRVDLQSASGNSVISTPLTNQDGSLVIYSATTLQGNACSGVIASDPCNPAVLNGTRLTGTYSCAFGNTTDTDFEIQ